ncbi:MAG: hypothetical protein UY04_C0027G0011 [Parcubacteria group bacterium GW2011_GWA2_47_7]|nr:MAG: hypothetical protein UY04_C0027G0011 [Parcubacteria group bacterium GW2011_GWA2_47_7]
MLDVTILADEVSYLLNTRYRNANREELPFGQAFTDVMNKHEVVGTARHLLKTEIGTILGMRRKTNMTKIKRAIREKQSDSFDFTVVEKSRQRVVLSLPLLNIEIGYIRDRNGMPIWIYSKGYASAEMITEGGKRAKLFFAEMVNEEIHEAWITLGERSAKLVTLIIMAKWKMVACQGLHGSIVAQICEIRSGKPVKQKTVPEALRLEARAIAAAYFADTKTADMFD